jgi:RNA polymerase sigma factor (sigma-70 family)
MSMRDQAIEEHVGLARSIARHVYYALGIDKTGAIERDDLEAEALVALIRAVDTFDPDRGTKMRTHVHNRVWGHVRHTLRRCDPKGRHNRAMVNRGDEWAERAMLELGREPTLDEIEHAVPGYRAAKARIRQRMSVPLDAPVRDSSGRAAEFGCIGDGIAAPLDVEAFVIEQLDGEAMWRLAERLPARTRALLALRYRDGLTPTEIARELHLPQETVDNVLMRGRHRLRTITAHGGPSAA